MGAKQLVNYVRISFEIIGGVTILTAIVSGLAVFVGWNLGVWPLFMRLGMGRWYRKVTIAADGDNYNSLRQDLIDSGIFREKNISQVNTGTLSKIKNSTLILLNYQSFSDDEIQKILEDKCSTAGMVVYYPIGAGKIPDNNLSKINLEPFTTLCNMRGRLVNDLLLTLLSTSYEKK